MLIAILLLLSSGSLIIVVDIGVVIPKPSDQPNPDVQMCRFRIEVKFSRITGSLGILAEAFHGLQCLKGRQLEQGILKLIDLLYQLWRRLLAALIVPGCPPAASIIIRTGIGKLADRAFNELHRRLVGVLEHL